MVNGCLIVACRSHSQLRSFIKECAENLLDPERSILWRANSVRFLGQLAYNEENHPALREANAIAPLAIVMNSMDLNLGCVSASK
jgi:hypothetical protein